MGTPKHILNSQANQLVGLIEKAGLHQPDFDWKETALTQYSYVASEDYITDMLMYRPTEEMREGTEQPETFYTFGREDVYYRPGDEKLQDHWIARDWETKVLYFVHWLNNIKREAKLSLWERITAGATLPAAALDVPDTPFTPEEQAEILRRLEGMAAQIEVLTELTREQKQAFTAKLQVLGDAVGRMGRGAWLDRAIGGVLGVLLATDVQHSVAASLLRWAVSMFHSAITGGAAPPLLLSP